MNGISNCLTINEAKKKTFFQHQLQVATGKTWKQTWKLCWKSCSDVIGETFELIPFEPLTDWMKESQSQYTSMEFYIRVQISFWKRRLSEQTHINHIFCKGNQCTDFLAKEWSPTSDSFVLHLHPLPLFCTNYFWMLGVWKTL